MSVKNAIVICIIMAIVASANAQIPYWSGNQTVLNVCTSEYSPMVYCSDREPDAYSGYEIEAFRKVAQVLGWTSEMLNWKCLESYDALVEHLVANDGECDLVVAGLEVTPERIDSGLVYAWPTYRSGLTILVKNSQQTTGMWSFWDAFEWQLWVATALTAVAVGVIVWFIDWIEMAPAARDPAPNSLSVDADVDADERAALQRDLDIQRYIWEATTRPMMTRDHIAFTFAGNIVVTVFSFAMLIVFILYLGNTAANVTLLKLETGGIDSIESLQGKAVGTYENYAEDLRTDYSVAAAGYAWDNAEDEAIMFDALQSGAIKALVLDAPLLEYTAATDCSVSVVGGVFSEFDQATAFPKGFSDEAFLNKYEEVMVSLAETGDLEQLQNDFITPPESECVELYSSAVSLEQVAGLWIIIAICFVVAVIVAIIEKRVVAKKNGRSNSAAAEAAAAIESEIKVVN